MTTHNCRSWFSCAIMALAVLWTTGTPQVAAQQSPAGTLKLLQITTSSTGRPSVQLITERGKARAGILIPMRYCPPGVASCGEPGSPTQEVKFGFLIADSEVTQEVFFQVLDASQKDEELRQWCNKMDAAKSSVRSKKEDYLAGFVEDEAKAGQKLYEGDQYPVYGVTLPEAVRFCKALEHLYSSNGRRLVALSFRLPTDVEWQYASRGCASPDAAAAQPHFNDWFKFSDLNIKQRTSAEDFWKKEMPGEPVFVGTQTQVVTLLSKEFTGDGSNGKKDEARRILRDLLVNTRNFEEAVRPLRWELQKVPSVLGEVGVVPVGGWHPLSMHGGVAEWVLKNRADWELLASGTPPTSKILVAGGGFMNGPLALSGGGWKTFTIWGSIEHPYDKCVTPDGITTIRPGIRLVIETLPAADLVATTRRIVFASEGDPANGFNSRIATLDRELALLQSEHPDAAKSLVQAANVYKALAAREAGEYDTAGKYLTAAGDTERLETKSFLDAFSYQLGNDKKKSK